MLKHLFMVFIISVAENNFLYAGNYFLIPTYVPKSTPTETMTLLPTLTPNASETVTISGSSGLIPATLKPTMTPVSSTPEILWTEGSSNEKHHSDLPKKESKWMSTVGIGLGIPPSMDTQKAYSPSFVFNLGSGIQFSKKFQFGWI